ncbi:MAG: DUF2723 domain-containing protein [Gemmatimonadales bacterium]|nr:DUF2723 domain-containing protein [Gemmatimonadales bacterium]
MTSAADATTERPPYLLALLAAGVVLAGYVFTLAPSVTFWDAGEFISASHILGIPHPPGTPMFVILGRVWDAFFPVGTTAFKTNLMSATFSACASGFLFLFMHSILGRGTKGMEAGAARVFRVGGAFAAALIAAYVFTNWQNSNETEVYQISMFAIGAIAWLCWLWRRDRNGPSGAHELLLLIYILGIALSTHLMGLLVGPAVIAYMYHVLRTEPARDPKERQVQWAEFLVAGSLWVTMVGVGIGAWPIAVLGLLLFGVAAYFAYRAGTLFFAGAALVVAAIGVSGFLYLFIRAGLHPYVNEADPSTWSSLWSVIRREQYPFRSPLDNPIYPHGPDNPGRTLSLLALQILNYIQYFDWQWSAGLQRAYTLLAPARLPFTLLFTGLGIWGATEHRKWDRPTFWFIATLFATTSLGLVLYLNFKPGFSLALQTYADREMHEVRERDYFFTVSYVAWGLWAGLGLAAAYRALRERLSETVPVPAAGMVFAAALIPFALNFNAASRKHGPSATLARDFAYNMLMSVEPYGILFTNGDNDTFPLWYAQEVEEIRQDVVVVNLSLINTDWYIRQLRDNPARPYRPDSAAIGLYGREAGPPPACSAAWADTLDAWARAADRRGPDRQFGMPTCLHTLTDDQIVGIQPQLLSRDLVLHVGNITHTYPANTPMYVKDIMVLRLIQENLGRRPIYFALTAGSGSRMGLDQYMNQQALAFKLMPDPVTSGPEGLFGTKVDVERTRTLVWDVFRYARLFDVDSLELDPTDDNIAGNLAFNYMTLGEAYRQLGNAELVVANFRKANHLSPNPELERYVRTFEAATVNPAILGPDTVQARPESGAAGARPAARDSSGGRR